MSNRSYLWGYPFDDVTLKEVIDFVVKTIDNNEKHYFVVQNTNKMYLSAKDELLYNVISNASLILPENSFYIGNMLMGKRLKQYNLTRDLVEKMLETSNNNKYSIYFLGSTNEVLTCLKDNISKKYPNIKIIGYKNGFFNSSEERNVVEVINKLRPNILIVGMGSPRQELFIYRNFRTLNTNISIGMGGALKLLAGVERPAPKWVKYGLEWLYRACQDPHKMKRYVIVNTFFLKEFFLKGLLKI